MVIMAGTAIKGAVEMNSFEEKKAALRVLVSEALLEDPNLDSLLSPFSGSFESSVAMDRLLNVLRNTDALFVLDRMLKGD